MLTILIQSLISINLQARAFVYDSPNFLVGRRADELNLLETCYAAAPLRASSASDPDLAASSLSPATIKKEYLFQLIDEVPMNAPSSKVLTEKILSAARELEELCPTTDESVLNKLGGNWELIWTAQDRSSVEGPQSLLANWINPLENQSYSNNPNGKQAIGRANPILPQNIQDKLEEVGILSPTSPSRRKKDGNNDNRYDVDLGPAKSNQIIDLKKSRVRNIVTFEAAAPPLLPSLPFLIRKKTKPNNSSAVVRGSLTVDVKFAPNKVDLRKVDVKFDRCRLVLQQQPLPLDITFPLGIVGPTGWLRTNYIDDTFRITRGHKGSVFILSRASKTSKIRD